RGGPGGGRPRPPEAARPLAARPDRDRHRRQGASTSRRIRAALAWSTRPDRRRSGATSRRRQVMTVIAVDRDPIARTLTIVAEFDKAAGGGWLGAVQRRH